MSVARFIADQRTKYRVPHALTCVLLGVSLSWFYKWIARAANTDGLHTDTDRRRAQLDTAVATAFRVAKGLHGSPRLVADLRDLDWVVSEKTVADSMRRQGLVARHIKRRNGLTKQDKMAPKFPDLVKRDFTAAAPNLKWVGDMTEIPTLCGQKLYLATVIDLYRRRLLGAAMGLHPDAELACAAIKMAVAVRGGRQAIWRDEESERVIFHTDRGSTGGFQRSSQHLDDGGVWWRRERRSRRPGRPKNWLAGGGSGRRIGHCGPRCAHPGVLSRPGRFSVRSGA